MPNEIPAPQKSGVFSPRVHEGSLTSIELPDVSRFFEGLDSYQHLVKPGDVALRDFIRNRKPVARVFYTRLEPKETLRKSCVGRTAPWAAAEVQEAPLHEEDLFDLSEIGKSMCFGVGRFPTNQFQPRVDLTAEYFTLAEPSGLGYDRSLDLEVSREHGWVLMGADGKVFYRDVGTQRKGSTNGTRIRDQFTIMNQITPWAPEDYLGVGKMVRTRGDDCDIMQSVFKLRYEWLK